VREYGPGRIWVEALGRVMLRYSLVRYMQHHLLEQLQYYEVTPATPATPATPFFRRLLPHSSPATASLRSAWARRAGHDSQETLFANILSLASAVLKHGRSRI
jgi:hypothetical protein